MIRRSCRTLTAFLSISLSIAGLVTVVRAASTLGGAIPGPLPMFPPDNWWNLDISNAPVDPASANYISFIGTTRRMHPDFGGDVSPGSVQGYGFPYVVVDSTVALRAVQFQYSDESDGVDHATDQSFPFYPIPDEAIAQAHWIEGGDPGNVDLRDSSDRHLLIVDPDRRSLYELYNVFYNGTQWHAGSGARFNLDTNERRPDEWTSADAAGLAILPGLVRYDEVFGADEIRHAFRVTVRATNGYVYPASHRAGSTSGALPMGARLRLKASKDLSGFTPELQKIFRAMQRYGLIVADNGSDLYVSGTYDTRWNNDVLNPAFRALTATDFEVITLGYRPAQATGLVNRYRLYSPATLEHLYTTDLNEYTVLGQSPAWIQEGVASRIYNGAATVAGHVAVPYYRLYDFVSRWHLWTTDQNEYDTLRQFTFRYIGEGIDGYIFRTPAPGTVPWYRLTLPLFPGLHHWTADQNERDTLVNQHGWVEEQKEYVFPAINLAPSTVIRVSSPATVHGAVLSTTVAPMPTPAAGSNLAQPAVWLTEPMGLWAPDWQVHPANLNADESTDFFFYNPAQGSWVQAFTTDGDVSFTYTTGNWDPELTLAAADLNGDGLTDFFLENPVSGAWLEAFSDGTGDFTYIGDGLSR